MKHRGLKRLHLVRFGRVAAVDDVRGSNAVRRFILEQSKQRLRIDSASRPALLQANESSVKARGRDGHSLGTRSRDALELPELVLELLSIRAALRVVAPHGTVVRVNRLLLLLLVRSHALVVRPNFAVVTVNRLLLLVRSLPELVLRLAQLAADLRR